jgi:hypothetical protein
MSALRPFIPQFQTLFCVAANDEIGQFQQSAMAETQVSVEDMDSGPSISEVDSATQGITMDGSTERRALCEALPHPIIIHG